MPRIRCGPPILLVGNFVLWCSFLSVPGFAQAAMQDQEIEVRNLPSLIARSPHSTDVLLTSLDIVFHDREICCGKDSALEDSVQAADPKSLKDIASKLQGRQLLSDGRPIKVTAEYLTADQVSAGHMMTMMLNQHAALMLWNSHLYIVHGLVYLYTAGYGPDGGRTQAVPEIHKFLLWDVRYSDARHEVVFDRVKDDVKAVQGVLFLEAKIE